MGPPFGSEKGLKAERGKESAGPLSDLVREQFAARSAIYDRVSAWIADPGLLGCFTRLCRKPANAVLLDVCCGTGMVGGAFKGRVARRVGVDLSPAMLDRARARLDDCRQGSIESLPFEDESFDVATMRQALHFVPDPAWALREIGRVLKPGGQLLLGHRVPYGDVDAAWWARVNAAKQPLLKNAFVERDLRKLLADAGFELRESADYYLYESISRWTDSPEARPMAERILALYRDAPPEIIRLRGIEMDGADIRDRWRWLILSGEKLAAGTP